MDAVIFEIDIDPGCARVITESCGSDAHMKKAAYPSA
jgi:hypothetical protein